MRFKKVVLIAILCVVVLATYVVYCNCFDKNYSYTVIEREPDVLASVNGKVRGHFTFPTEVEGKKITKLGWVCLVDQKHITKVTVPNGIIAMSHSIRGCDNITELYIGKDLEDIYSPLLSSPKLRKIVVDECNPYYYVANGCLIDRRNNWLYLATNGAVIPENVEFIASGAFTCHALTEDLIIPDSVKEIDEYAMSGLTGKANVYIPQNTYVWWSAFFGASEEVTFCFEAEHNSTGEWMAERGYSVRFGVEIPQQ